MSRKDGVSTNSPPLLLGYRTAVVQFFPLCDLSVANLIANAVPLDLNCSNSALHGTLLYNIMNPESSLGVGAF